VRFVSLGSRRPCTDRCHFALTSKSFLSIFDFGVNHSYFASVMTKLTIFQIDVAPSIFTRFLSRLLRYHRTTRALLSLALALSTLSFLSLAFTCHSVSVLRRSHLDFLDPIFFAPRFYACAHTCSLVHGTSTALCSVLFMFYTCDRFLTRSFDT
jgi:hypothetical protein